MSDYDKMDELLQAIADMANLLASRLDENKKLNRADLAKFRGLGAKVDQLSDEMRESPLMLTLFPAQAAE
jgi:hypothetical protein